MNEAKFVWHELMTVDPVAAKEFYGKVFGWTWRDDDLGDMGTYTLWFAGGKHVAGMMAVDKGHGFPSQWYGYATVPDVDEATRRAEAQGAKVFVKPNDVPNVGRTALFADLQGAMLWAFRPAQPETVEEGVGHFCWDELHTPDPKVVIPFYGEIFGWKTEAQELPGYGMYWVLRWGNEERGGIVKSEGAWKGWLGYVKVDDVDAVAKKVATFGGKVVTPPADMPWGRYAVVCDPTGARFALWKSAPKK
jgi:predicted enzyme related to lactoylglutathione lyase